MNRRQVFKLSGSGIVVLFAAAFGFPAIAAKDEIYTGLVSGVAAGGYDVVAYFSEKKAVRGSKGITAEHGGVIWWFATNANREAFVADPERYAPQYGGYCAWAVANGYTAKGDPNAWSVVDGKLYLNYSESVRQQWSKDIAGNISKGNANWPDVLN